MQKESTIQFWDEYHQNNAAQEWIVFLSDELSSLIYNKCSPKRQGCFRVLEIGCGTSTMARDFWMYLNQNAGVREIQEILVRSTDVSTVSVSACFERDKEIPHVHGPESQSIDGQGLEYCTLDVLEIPGEDECGEWDAILDKACMDTFLFRSRQRGEHKAYPAAVRTALNNIWRLLGDNGVYFLLSPRSKLKAVRDFLGFSSVERHTIRSESKGRMISKPSGTTGSSKEEEIETCYLYVCHKNPHFDVTMTDAFRQEFRTVPTDTAKCEECDIDFKSFRNGEAVDGRGAVFWARQWKNHCIHCK